MKRSLFVFAIALPCFGFTCEYFSQASVSTTETFPPIVGARMWVDGVESIQLGDISEHTITGDAVVFPFVFDTGGARMLTLQQNVDIHCHDDDADPELAQNIDVPFFNKVASQPPASAGQLRSNGLFVAGDVTDLSSFDWYCSSGFDLVSVTYSWAVTGRDYSGNEATAWGSVLYMP